MVLQATDAINESTRLEPRRAGKSIFPEGCGAAQPRLLTNYKLRKPSRLGLESPSPPKRQTHTFRQGSFRHGLRWRNNSSTPTLIFWSWSKCVGGWEWQMTERLLKRKRFSSRLSQRCPPCAWPLKHS